MKHYFEKWPLVSVVIPVYNRMKTIERSIRSVLNQTYNNIELLIIDDGSIDDTLEVIRKLNITNIKVLKQNHKGANVARNLGISAAKGEFIAFLDSDDEWMSDKLEKQILYMWENNYEVCYCPYFICENKQNSVLYPDYKDKQKYEDDLLELLRIGNVIGTVTLVVHRNVFAEIGVFDEEMPRYQDYEFVIRIVQKKKIGYINEPLVKVHRSDNSISNNDKKKKKANMLLLSKHKDFFNIEASLKKYIQYEMNALNESDWSRKIENIDKYLKSIRLKKDINVYKLAMEVLNHQYNLFCDSCTKEYELRIKKLQSKKFAIYGAGKIGEKIYIELAEKKLTPQCFLVSEKKENSLYEIPILELEKWKKKDMEIIIGVSRELQFDLIETLLRRGYTNYFRYPYL